MKPNNSEPDKQMVDLLNETRNIFYLLDIDDMFAIRGGGNEYREEIFIEF